MQEYSTRPTDNIGDPVAFKVAATFLYDRVKESSPAAQIILYETWARHEDHSYYPDSFADRDEMQEQLIITIVQIIIFRQILLFHPGQMLRSRR